MGALDALDGALQACPRIPDAVHDGAEVGGVRMSPFRVTTARREGLVDALVRAVVGLGQLRALTVEQVEEPP